MSKYSQEDIKKIISAIERFKGGDKDAFNEFYSLTYEQVFKTCAGLLKNEQDAEDITQEVFIRAYEKLDSLAEPATFGQWLKVISTNTCLNELKKKERTTVSFDETFSESEDEDWASFDQLPNTFIEDEEKNEIINKVLKDSLSDVQYQALRLFYYEEMSMAQIAEQMDCPEGTVKTRIKSAKAKFKESLEKYVDENKLVLSATPFLARFFLAQETKLKVPPMPPFTFPGIGAGTAATAGTAGATAAATAKAGFFSTVIGKIIIGVGAVVVLGVATVIGINAFNNRFEKPIETEEESESDSIDASEESSLGVTDTNITNDPDEVDNGKKLANGYLIKITKYGPDGSVETWTEYEYDNNGMLTYRTIYLSDGSIHCVYKYEFGNDDLLTKMTYLDSDGSIDWWYEYEYDSNDLLIKRTSYNSDGIASDWLEYEYDESGNLVKSTLVGSTGVLSCRENEYDANGQLIAVVISDAYGISDKYEYSYDINGNMLSATNYYYVSSYDDFFYEGKQTYDYNADGILIKKTGYGSDKNISSWGEYEYDAYGNVSKITKYNSDGNITGWTEYEYSYKLPVESASDMPIGSEITAETTTETTAVAIAEVSITEETLDSENKFKVPVVSISGIDMTEINDSMRSFSEKYYGAMNSAEYSGPTSSDYTAYEGDGFISIVLRAEKLTDIYNYLNVYNISTETGELLGKDDFLSLVGMSSEDFDNLVAGTLNTAMDDAPETFGNTVPADGDWNSDPGSWVTLRTLNTSSERISAAIPFISDNGNLCFICQFNTSPYSSMDIPIIFDTVTHEHWYFSNYGWESFSDI